MKKKVLSMALAFVMIFGTALTSFAAEYDLIHKTGNPKHSFTEFAQDSAITKEVGSDLANYVMEYKGKYYSTQDLQDFMLKNPGKMIKDAVASGIPEKQKPGTETNMHIMSISAITSTQVEVTLRDSVTAVAASDFAINNGVSVMEAKIKPETDNKTVVLTTTPHEEKNYELTYKNSNPFLYIGKINLGAVLLEVKDNKAEIEINPSLHELTPAEITATLVGFPEGTEAVIAFSSSFGDIVSQKTTENQKVTVQLKPQVTLVEQTAIVKGQVIDVKNPKTGKSYPEFKNSTVNTLNIRFKVVQESESGKTYAIKVAYADQADRVYIPLTGGLEAEFDKILKYQPETLAAGTENRGVRALVRSMHDIMFTKIEEKVEAFVAEEYKKAPAERFSEESIEKFKAVMGDVYKKTTADDMRKMLVADVGAAHGYASEEEKNFYKDRYDSFYKRATGKTKVQLVQEIQGLYNNGTLEGMLSYYRALSKFIVEDNVKDVQAPVNPDMVYPVEHLYKEEKAGEVSRLVLVLPANRAKDPYKYSPAYTQIWEFSGLDNYAAKSLKDNASHRLIFVNSDSQSQFRISGDPTFALADREELRIISAAVESYDGYKGEAAEERYCPIPYGVDVEKTGHSDVTDTYEGLVSKARYTISPDFVRAGVKYAELKVVFSESVYNEYIKAENKGSIYNLANWTIDGRNLKDYFDADMSLVNIRVVSTDAKRHLRDAAIISFITRDLSKLDPVKDFVESSARKKVEINSVGDWAYRTDANNIIKTDSYEYNGQEAPSVQNGQQSVAKEFAAGDPFVVRAIADKNAPDYDYIYVLFSEPMTLTGNNSPLLKQVYTVDSTKGEDLASGELNITKGIKGTPFADSPCAFTLRLKKNTLATSVENTLTIKNAMSQVASDKSVDVSIQLPYARELVLKGDEVSVNGIGFLTDRYEYGEAIDADNAVVTIDKKDFLIYPIGSVEASKVEMLVYEDEHGNTMDIKEWVAVLDGKHGGEFAKVLADFLTLHPVSKPLTEEELKALAKPVVDMIAALPDAATIVDEKSAKEADPKAVEARKAYDKLSKPVKEKVTNLKKLEDLEAAILKYKPLTEEELKALAKPVVDMIAALPDAATIVDEKSAKEADPKAVEARKAYDKLDPKVQAKVTNLKKLEDLEAAIKKYLIKVELENVKIVPLGVLDTFTVSGTLKGADDPTKYEVQIFARKKLKGTATIDATGAFTQDVVFTMPDLIPNKAELKVIEKGKPDVVVFTVTKEIVE